MMSIIIIIKQCKAVTFKARDHGKKWDHANSFFNCSEINYIRPINVAKYLR